MDLGNTFGVGWAIELPHGDRQFVEYLDGNPVDGMRAVRASSGLFGENLLKEGLHYDRCRLPSDSV
jgi:hypothetical protein